MSKQTVTQERLKELLDYDPDTGLFTWKVRRSRSALVGSIAGRVDKEGYICIKVDQKNYYGHRLAMLWMTGEWPSDEVDHINRIRSDNRYGNLRNADRRLNALNNNAKGYRWCPTSRKWLACLSGKPVGYFVDERDARAAYLRAKRKTMQELAA